VVTISTEVPGA